MQSIAFIWFGEFFRAGIYTHTIAPTNKLFSPFRVRYIYHENEPRKMAISNLFINFRNVHRLLANCLTKMPIKNRTLT